MTAPYPSPESPELHSTRSRRRVDWIGAFPEPVLTHLGRRAGAFAAMLPGFAALHGSAREALYWGFRGLSLPPGSRVWMPSFHCGAEVQAALDAGLSVGFYRVGADLSLDLADLRRKLRSCPGPVLVIHYFGFPQSLVEDLAEICSREQQVLIEDCAQALFSTDSGTPLGSFAPISVYSLWKSLPLYDGGALAVDRNAVLALSGKPFTGPKLDRFPLQPYSKVAKWFVDPIGSSRARAGGASDRLRPLPRTAPMSALSRRLAAAADPPGVVEDRRRNYLALARALAEFPGYCPLFSGLAPGICPLCLPIRVANRAGLLDRLGAERIVPFVFGASPHRQLSDEDSRQTLALRNEIVGLPVHQELRFDALARIAFLVGQWTARHNNIVV